MKTLGITGGLSPESTRHYYEWICDDVRKTLGGLNYPEIVMATVNQQFVYENKKSGDWDAIAEKIISKAQLLERAGAEYLLIASNTMHNVAPQVEAAINIPLLHVADVTAKAVVAQGLTQVAMLSTIESAELDFYKDRFIQYGVELIFPKLKEEREAVDQIICGELCKGEVSPDSKLYFIEQAEQMFDCGAQGLILGCTEVNMLVGQEDFSKPVFDTTKLHVDAAVSKILSAVPSQKKR